MEGAMMSQRILLLIYQNSRPLSSGKSTPSARQMRRAIFRTNRPISMYRRTPPACHIGSDAARMDCATHEDISAAWTAEVSDRHDG